MIRGGFFNSKEGDRTYNADDLSYLYEGILKDGVFRGVGEELAVSVGDSNDFSVCIGTGKCVLSNRWCENTTPITRSATAADNQRRYDTVCVTLNYATRSFDIEVVKGAPSDNPAPPELASDVQVRKLPLAYLVIEPNMSKITANEIIDAREYAALAQNTEKATCWVKDGVYWSAGGTQPSQYGKRAGATRVYDIDTGNCHHTSVSMTLDTPMSLAGGSDAGYNFAVPLPDQMKFPEYAAISIHGQDSGNVYINDVVWGYGSETGHVEYGARSTCGYIWLRATASAKVERITANFTYNADFVKKTY